MTDLVFLDPDKTDVIPYKLFKLPTAMEEEEAENPVIYNWLVKNGFELFYDNDGRLMVRSDDDEFEDMEFATFARMTIAFSKQC